MMVTLKKEHTAPTSMCVGHHILLNMQLQTGMTVKDGEHH
jgi:hypothetical protein